MSNAILLASGIGKRMAPIPKCNKSLLPILNNEGKPNILNTFDILRESGINSMIVCVRDDNFEPFSKIIEEYTKSYPNISLVLRILPSEYEGMNNVVTLKNVADFIGDTYIVETDQYLQENLVGYLKHDDKKYSKLFTQQRYDKDDWFVVSNDEGICKSIKHNNTSGKGFCLAGVSYINNNDALILKDRLLNCIDYNLYWEELLDFGIMQVQNLKFYEPYSTEYDNISDLINQKLMDPQSIANFVDDNHEASRLNSMTNTTYLIDYEGAKKVLRISGYGTEKFVNRTRESAIDNYVYKVSEGSLNPSSTYFSNGSVKLTEYLEGYHTLESLKDFPEVCLALYKLHTLPPMEEGVSTYSIDLKKEISDYENIYEGNPTYTYSNYDYYKGRVLNFLDNWFETHELNIVHRDLFPTNIMLKGKDVKFIDWEYSGYLSQYWDFASLVCEYIDETSNPSNKSLQQMIDLLVKYYPEKLDSNDILAWVAVVDFVWSVWSLAKYELGDDVLDYGIRRYRRCSQIIENLYI